MALITETASGAGAARIALDRVPVVCAEDDKGNLAASHRVLVPDALIRRQQDRKTTLFGGRQEHAVRHAVPAHVVG